VKVGDRIIDVDTQTVTKESDSRGTKTATMAGGGAVLGAVIGGIAGGGKGAAIGAAAGAGAGTGAELATKGQRVKIPSETQLTFVLDNAVRI
jgi:outer membrane lipoprotein SlyB